MNAIDLIRKHNIYDQTYEQMLALQYSYLGGYVFKTYVRKKRPSEDSNLWSDLILNTVRYLTDMGHSESEIERAFSEFPEVMKALDEYSIYTQETEDVMDMDVEEYVDMEKREYVDEKFGGDYYEYLDDGE